MKRYLLYIIFILFSVCSIHAEFSLIHQTGMYDVLQENGMQQVHTETHIIYANPGDTLRLYRPERMAFTGYIRWYCYDTDNAANGIIHNGYTVSAWGDLFTISNEKGLFKRKWGKSGTTNRQSTEGKEYYEVDYIMHSGDSIYRIAVDESIYWDYEPDNDWRNKKITTLTEPTLSKRIIYEMHPASEIAGKIDTCVGNIFLEEHELIAPVGRQLYIGPNYRFRCKDEGQLIYRWKSHSNYYYNEANPTQMYEKSDWKWEIDGIIQPDFTMISSQYIAVSSTSQGIHTYKLKFKVGDTYYNIAKFIINYIDTTIVGPVENLPMSTTKLDMIYENTFNYNKPGVTNMAFWNGHFDADESTYGYYIENLKTYRDHHNDEPNWCEYGIVNAQDIWTSSGARPWVYNHVDGLKNLLDNAKKGYMIFVDGSQQPGEVFNLKVNTDLCPGAKMYFSAWLIDASSTGDGNKCAPNMDFIVVGIDDNQKEHILTTFTTGEFGCNAKKAVNKSGNMERGVWYQIMFPVSIGASEIYQTYKLKITNKGKSADGNDFAIDDIRVYVLKPSVIPILASTSDCIDKPIDSIRTYLRIDYQMINHDDQPLYYQWRENNNIVHTNYYNIDSASTTFGKLNIIPSGNITPADTCSDLLSFDKRYRATKDPVIRYILEEVGPDTSRYVMYIAMPMEVKINHEYTGFVALSQGDLGKREGCGTFADMIIAGGTRIIIDDEISFSDSVITVCGHRSYTLNIVLTKIILDTEHGELRIDTTHCKADWLIGDSTYVNSHQDIYKYSFDEIERGLGFYHQHVPSAIQMVNFLKQHGLLILDTASIVMNPGVSLSYTAFPIDGSSTDGRTACTSPRFLHINPAIPASNMMEIGDSTDVLPDVILSQPRIVRISNALKNTATFSIPMYLKGDKNEVYEIDSVYMISSTNPNCIPITLTADHKTMSLTDTVILTSDSLHLLEAGYDYTFHVAFKGESDEDRCDRGYTYFTLRIIPDIVTWYGGDWNMDINWDYFIPMKETNVVLIDSIDYIISFNDTSLAKYDVNYTENQCNHIYFPDSTSMYGLELITINGKAFVDIKEYAWKWTLTSVPIKGVVSGDFFVKVGESTVPFIIKPISQTVGTLAEDRITWQLYRKVFNAETSKWQTSTNSLVDPIEQGSTDMIGVDCENENDIIIIRLPKQDNIYHYYDKNTHLWLNEYEYISRNSDYGKPIWNGDTIIKLKEPYTNIYLFGNPTFGYIDITELINDNKDKFTGRYYYEGQGAYKIPKKTEDIVFNGNVYEDIYHKLLPPYRGILLEGTRESDSIIINLTTKHINPQGKAPKRRIYNNDNNVATNIDYINIDEITRIYDIMGRYIGSDFDKLPNGIYIIRRGKNTLKVFKG